MIELGLSQAERDIAQQVKELGWNTLRPIFHKFGERHEICREAVDEIAGAGFFGLNIDSKFGGAGNAHRYSTLLCILRENLGYCDPSADFTFGLQGLGTVAIVKYGTESQKERYLTDLVRGKKVFALAMTEPLAGSDVQSMSTTAQVGTNGYTLNGSKTYISGAPDSDVYVVFARTDGLVRGRGITAFIVEKGTTGFSAKQDIALAAPHAIGSLKFEDCEIPAENIVGVVGSGLNVALGTLEVYRPSVGALAVGMSRRAIDLATEFARGRKMFGKTLLDFDATKSKIATMWLDMTFSRGLVYHAASIRDREMSSAREAAVAKLFATETAHRTIYESQQIHGARGVTLGSEIELLSRHIRQATIYEGTSEVQRTIIARAEIAKNTYGGTAEEMGIAGVVLSELHDQIVNDASMQNQTRQFRFADLCVSIDCVKVMKRQLNELRNVEDSRTKLFELAVSVAEERAVNLCSAFLKEFSKVSVLFDEAERKKYEAQLSNGIHISIDSATLEIGSILLNV